MQDVLDELSRVRGVSGCILFSPDGLPMAASLRSDMDSDALAASIASTITRGYALCQRMGLGKPRMMHALGQGGLVLLASGPSYLAILADPNANLALLQLEARPFVDVITKRLSL